MNLDEAALAIRLAELLREARHHTGLSMSQVASRLFRLPSYVWAYERTKAPLRRLRVDELVRICVALEVDPVELLRQAVSPP